mgnify:CR=1 FL=1
MLLRGGLALSFEVKKIGHYYDIHRKTKKFKVYVVRHNEHNENFQESQPCISCEISLKKMGFKKIIYSTKEGKVEKRNIKDLNTKHFSKAQKITHENIEKKKKNKKWF